MFGQKKKFKQQWQENLSDETSFWKSLVDSSNEAHPEWAENFHRRAVTPQRFPEELEQYLPENRDVVLVLDIGAGPITQLGSEHPDRDIRITPIDPLANEYDEMLSAQDIEPVHPRTIKGEAEQLSKTFGKSKFDFAYSRNALDHSYDPVRAIKEILKVIKPNCFFYLYSYINEGVGGNYQGLHQWNFDLADSNDDFHIWNESVRYSMKKELPRGTQILTGEGESPDWMFAALRKG